MGALVGLVALLAAACAPSGRSSAPREATAEAAAPVRRMKIIAHRGASREAPENTLAAVERAWEIGVDGVEIDVHLSRDGVPVVIHDADTRRTAGVDRPVADQTLAELRELDVGRWMGAAFEGERIPTLAEVVATVPAGRTLFVEIKSAPDTVATVLAALPADAPVAFEGFDAAVLVEIRRHRPSAQTFWLVGTERDDRTGRRLPVPLAVVDRARALGVSGLALDARGVTDELRAALARAGFELYVWTIDDPRAMSAFAEAGAAWMETNAPALAVETLQAR